MKEVDEVNGKHIYKRPQSVKGLQSNLTLVLVAYCTGRQQARMSYQCMLLVGYNIPIKVLFRECHG